MSSVTPADDSARALYQAMIGPLGPAATGWTGALELPAAPRSGLSVLVLGAGIGGLTAAYELSARGFTCTVLEAQDRTGGRNRTAHSGDELIEIGSSGTPEMTHRCSFDGDLYFNLGPGRIPYHHRRVLKYCRDFGVALEPYIMETTANLVRLSAPVRARWHNRRVANDVRGHLAALAYRYLSQGGEAFGDEAFSGDLRDLLRVFGDLSPDGRYLGSTRSGYELDPDNGFPAPARPLDFATLVASGFWGAIFYQPIEYLWQATMFQPVSGMDAIVTAFTDQLTRRFGPIIRLGAAVTSITLPDKGGRRRRVRPGREDPSTGGGLLPQQHPAANTARPDAVELHRRLHRSTPWASPPPAKSGGRPTPGSGRTNRTRSMAASAGPTTRSRRCGIRPTASARPAGVLTGAYNFGANAEYLGDLKPARRLEEACTGAIELHPEFQDPAVVPLDRGVSIAWHKVPYQLGGWAGWDPENTAHMNAYRTLLQPQGSDRFYVLGDQASPLPGWQEGAMMSAHYVSGQILGTIPLTVPEVVDVPDSVALTEGRR